MSRNPAPPASPNADPADAQETKNLLLSHEYDGIREYDNPMPKWWRWLFWASFYFSVGYFVHYQLTGNGETVLETYENDVALAREQEAKEALNSGISEQTLAELMAKSPMMNDAQKTFVTRCSQCHGVRGEGLIGPNLTDAYWLHGDATLMSLYQVIGDGVLTKGMPAWKRQLRPVELAKLAAYVGTLRNTGLKGPKGPEGKKLEPPQATPNGKPSVTPTAPAAANAPVISPNGSPTQREVE